jgi:uncharacterized membrane protein YjjP (DUF1212 family)
VELKEFKKRVRLAVAIGKELHKNGAAAHSLESALKDICDVLEIEGQFFATPTVLMASFKSGDKERQQISRVKPGTVDLERMSQLDALGDKIINKELDIDQTFVELERIVSQKPLYRPSIEIFAYALVSGSASVFFGASLVEVLVATILGFIVGITWDFCSKENQTNQIFEFLAAFIVSTCACILYTFSPNFSIQVSTLASLIVLVPGLTLTIAMTELATENLAAGTARLMQAILTFFKLGFGVALGSNLIRLFTDKINVVTVRVGELDPNAVWIALFTAAIAFTILFKATTRNFVWVLLAGVVGFFSTKLAAGIIGVDLGAFVGGLSVGITANLYAKFTKHPALTITMPGLILLVPGSIGFKGLSFLVEKNTLAGIDTTFEMFLIAIALVSGLLLANLIVSPKRSL